MAVYSLRKIYKCITKHKKCSYKREIAQVICLKTIIQQFYQMLFRNCANTVDNILKVLNASMIFFEQKLRTLIFLEPA